MKFDVSVITGWRYDFKIEADSIEQAGRKVEELYSEHSGERKGT